MAWTFRYLVFVLMTVPDVALGADAMALLKRDLGPAIEVISAKEIRYCPDNTCDVFRARNQAKEFANLVDLYLFYDSAYIYLRESIGGERPFRSRAVAEPPIRKEAERFCQAAEKSERCIIDGLKRALGIQICFARADEGAFCVHCGKRTSCKKL